MIEVEILEEIIYLINRIIDNINFKRNPDLKDEEIDPKYGKRPKMSEENEAIYDYALEHPYDPDDTTELKALISKWEGFSNVVYDDKQPYKKLQPGDKIKGILTIGIGHAKPINGKKLYVGMPPISDAKIEELFLEDINIAKKSVIKKVKVPLTQEQYDMLVSVSFNTGGEIIKNEKESTLLRLLNQGDYIGASEEFDKWIFFNKKPNEGLINRRADEKTKFKKVLFYINN